MTPAEVLAFAIAPFGLSTESILLLPRGKYRTHIRQVVILALRTECPYLALADIAQMIGLRGADHSTVLYHLNAAKRQLVGRPIRLGVI